VVNSHLPAISFAKVSCRSEMTVNLLAATFFRGWAIAAAGDAEEGITEMRRSIPEAMVTGALVWPSLLRDWRQQSKPT
jgi:hypothetical protein